MNSHISLTKPLAAAILALAVLLFMAGCTSSPLGRLGGVDSLINTRPDSALTLLNALLPDTGDMPEGDLMRYYLLRTNAQNKCDTVFRAEHAALMRRVCDYYDHKSSPLWGDKRGVSNSRMLAHYLLGRCYDDMGEAPAALEEFYDVVNHPDTANTVVDYGILYRAYSQLARLFYYHNLFDEQLKAIDAAEQYAFMAGDTLMAILLRGKKGEAIAATGLVDTAISISKDVYYTYHQRGENTLAAREAGYLASLMVEIQQYERLGDLLKEYEQFSGYFDEKTTIESGRELYYSVKGYYYLSQSLPDSAKTFFQHGFEKSETAENKLAACKGLRVLYQQKGLQDSIVKYSLLESSYKDSIRVAEHTDNVQSAQRMYVQNRHEREMAHAEFELNKQRQANLLQLSLFLSVLILGFMAGITLYGRAKRQRMMRESHVRMLEQQLGEKKRENEQAAADIEQLRKTMMNYEDSADLLKLAIDSKQSQLEENALIIQSLQTQLTGLTKVSKKTAGGDVALLKTKIVQRFQDYQLKPLDRPTAEEWGQLRKTAAKWMPSFHDELMGKNQLSADNYDICILLRLGFPSKAIASMKGLQPNTISTRLRSMHSIVFGIDGSSRDFVRYLKSLK